jgi:hypothetical protein
MAHCDYDRQWRIALMSCSASLLSQSIIRRRRDSNDECVTPAACYKARSKSKRRERGSASRWQDERLPYWPASLPNAKGRKKGEEQVFPRCSEGRSNNVSLLLQAEIGSCSPGLSFDSSSPQASLVECLLVPFLL